MLSKLAPFGSPVGRRWRDDRQPQRWVWVVAAAAWGLLVLHLFLGFFATSSGAAPGPGMADHALHVGHDRGGGSSSGIGAILGSVWVGVAMWVAMIAATMLPLIAANVRFVALRSPRRHRTAVMVDVVAGWAALWGAAAVVLALGTWVVERVVGPVGAVVAATAVAVWWQRTSKKRSAVNRCHRTFAPPLDRRSSRPAAVRYGSLLGIECVKSCWALMALMALCGHQLFALVPLAWVSWSERRRDQRTPSFAVPAAVIVTVGVAAAAAASVAASSSPI